MSAVVRRTLLGLLGVALFATAACGAPAQGGGTSDTTLTVAINTNPSSLDPQAGPSGTDHVALYPLYATLVEFDPATLKATPGLAESWSFTDPTTLQLKLRPGLKFSDGSPVTERRPTIRDTVKMKSRKTFARMHVGFINVTANRAKCTLLSASRV